MGAAMWIAAGVASFLVARIIPIHRPQRWTTELVVAVVIAAAGGIAATFLDFGGWKEADWRAGVFAFLLAFATVGIMRSISRTSGHQSSST